MGLKLNGTNPTESQIGANKDVDLEVKEEKTTYKVLQSHPL
jgi:hypothetical protein